MDLIDLIYSNVKPGTLSPVVYEITDILQTTLSYISKALANGYDSFLVGGTYLSKNTIHFLLDFAFYYPLFMAYLWMIGALIYYFHWERKSSYQTDQVPELSSYPPVSIIIPCHNEGKDITETIEYLLHQKYPDFEIIAVNDGSTDDSLEHLIRLSHQHKQVRVINLEHNQGKAVALNTGALFSKHEFLICIDGDALLAPEATAWMMRHFLNGPRVAAVTGNPRIRTRSTLLGKIQVGEFSAIIGLIKRAQRIYGRLFTVSGVVAGFRKSALQRVGYWSNDMLTEDIDISWKLQLDHWDIRYEPNALCWILMPETYRGLWRQRLRWAQGGSEVLLRYFRKLGLWKSRRMWPVYLEYFISVFWSYTMMLTFVLWIVGYFFVDLPEELFIPSLLPSWGGVLLGMTCLLQFAISLAIDSRYEKGIARVYYWMIWYPLAYWIIAVFTTFVGLIKALLKKRNTRAIWTSPDRGIR
ncbi:poly-beta-1,6 N-acetyl-D-glucosamine synthase [Methylicorpusculum oleiharenae]|uniref:poly-beta-1,6-N-acetyl-D-glucosamine synthase n=1 Tax=Methylicorpusculum oleiharenae TaxID=1338687 RepID=UPI001358B512|nr:poly-beta-1,6-N-acetyl-D-glucosamine synthase [Methylicorpusculum oleiharenae]MCD2450648.1 poly-beta-1,6 N-acetyl-D-glucosamine synthase [Methylicorpusculum oleiharenae]